MWVVQLPKVWWALLTVFLFGSSRLPAQMIALLPPSNLQETRAAVMALRAFNVETALVADSVKEAALAQIRMHWWRDAVDSLYGPKPQPHPVIQALKQARKLTSLTLPCTPCCWLDRRPAKVKQSSQVWQAILLPCTMQQLCMDGRQPLLGVMFPQLGFQVLGHMPATRYRLQRIVAAREADVCDSQPPASVAGLEAYGEDTAAQMLYLQACWPAGCPALQKAPLPQVQTYVAADTQAGAFVPMFGHHFGRIWHY